MNKSREQVKRNVEHAQGAVAALWIKKHASVDLWNSLVTLHFDEDSDLVTDTVFANDAWDLLQDLLIAHGYFNKTV